MVETVVPLALVDMVAMLVCSAHNEVTLTMTIIITIYITNQCHHVVM